jgi:hypothetical protein
MKHQRRTVNRTWHMGKLTLDMKRALLLLHKDGRLIQEPTGWRSRVSNLHVKMTTVAALFDRYLVIVCYGSDLPRRHIARLSDTGLMVAAQLAAECAHADPFKSETSATRHLSEDSDRFIAQVTA